MGSDKKKQVQRQQQQQQQKLSAQHSVLKNVGESVRKNLTPDGPQPRIVEELISDGQSRFLSTEEQRLALRRAD